MNIFVYFFLFIIGLVFGSFLTAYTYRYPTGGSVQKGRSQCPKCKSKISWFDNIPVLSYLLLSGNCRKCGQKISLRYPLIEISLGLLFVLVYFYIDRFCLLGKYAQGICYWQSPVWIILPFFLMIVILALSVFITDFENQIIPDEPVFAIFILSFIVLTLFLPDLLYAHLFSAFLSASIFVLLHVITKGRGMGLGDAKLALSIGMVLGWPMVIPWFLTSFVVGAVVGVILLVLKKASFGKHIAFGPFMIFAFFAVLFLGDILLRVIIPLI